MLAKGSEEAASHEMKYLSQPRYVIEILDIIPLEEVSRRAYQTWGQNILTCICCTDPSRGILRIAGRR